MCQLIVEQDANALFFDRFEVLVCQIARGDVCRQGILQVVEAQRVIVLFCFGDELFHDGFIDLLRHLLIYDFFFFLRHSNLPAG